MARICGMTMSSRSRSMTAMCSPQQNRTRVWTSHPDHWPLSVLVRLERVGPTELDDPTLPMSGCVVIPVSQRSDPPSGASLPVDAPIALTHGLSIQHGRRRYRGLTRGAAAAQDDHEAHRHEEQGTDEDEQRAEVHDGSPPGRRRLGWTVWHAGGHGGRALSLPRSVHGGRAPRGGFAAAALAGAGR